MPSVDDNLRLWENREHWRESGDDWSSAWGGAQAQWFGCLLPRLRSWLPTGTVLEIAPGHGRWTQFLVEQSERLVGVDLSPSCVCACRERFAGCANVEFHVNDGRSLEVVASESIDLVFSFDSLVHVERDVLGDYVVELADKLAPEGVAFIHHSNLGAYRKSFERFQHIPPRLRARLIERGIIDHSHLRASTVTASWFAQACRNAGLQCTGQELVNWGTRRLVDCISVVVRAGSSRARENCVVRNPHFMDEARSIRAASDVYRPR
jgi:SAM-dependent methyltransferase